MNTWRIRYFFALAETKNYTAAANALHISQPSLSKQIATLEQELGFPLFDRSRHHVALTPAGEYMLEWFKKVQDEYEGACRHAFSLGHSSKNSLNIGVLNGLNFLKIPKIIQLLSDDFPDAVVNFDFSDQAALISRLKPGEFDIIIGFDFPLPQISGMSQKQLFSSKHILIFSENHPNARKESPVISDFKNDVFILPSGPDKPLMGKTVVSLCHKHGFTPNLKPAASSAEACFQIVESGLGVALVDEFLFKNIVVGNTDSFRYIDTGIVSSISAMWDERGGKGIAALFVDLLVQSLN